MGDLKHELSQQQIERLRELGDAGVASGSARKLDMNKLRREARANLKAASTMSPSNHVIRGLDPRIHQSS